MLTIPRNEEKTLKKQNPQRGQSHERRETINSSVNSDIEKTCRGKTSGQLSALRSQINQKITGGGTVDIGYWQSLLQELNVFMAKSRVRENHQNLLKEKLASLKRKAVETSSTTAEEAVDEGDENNDDGNEDDEKESTMIEDEEKDGQRDNATEKRKGSELKRIEETVYTEEKLIERGMPVEKVPGRSY